MIIIFWEMIIIIVTAVETSNLCVSQLYLIIPKAVRFTEKIYCFVSLYNIFLSHKYAARYSQRSMLVLV
jgi:hypothetical protein